MLHPDNFVRLLQEMHKQKVEKQLKDYEKQQKMLRTLKDRGKSSKDAVDKAISKAKRDGAASKKSSKKSGAGGAGAGGGGTGDDGHDGDGGGGPGGEELIARPKEYAVRFTFNDPPELSPPVLAVSGASFRYGPSYPWLFNDLNFGIDQSSRVSIVGPNGVGELGPSEWRGVADHAVPSLPQSCAAHINPSTCLFTRR